MNRVYLTQLELKRFTAFDDFNVKLSPGINIFIGANGTGKTHILKVLYAATAISKSKGNFAEKLLNVFLPYERRIGRLVKRSQGSSDASVKIHSSSSALRMTFSNHTKDPERARQYGKAAWQESTIECAYIPVKEMLANAPGFNALYAAREISFEEIYKDIIDKALIPIARGPLDADSRKLIDIIQKAIRGKVQINQETFFLSNKEGKLEFTLLAEGMRKLGLLWMLISNKTLKNGSILFWDEPETNLNPKMLKTVVDILCELQKIGVQIFVATHDYVILKEFHLKYASEDSSLRYHSLYRDTLTNSIKIHSTNEFFSLNPNAIEETFADLFARDMRRAYKGQTI